MNYWNLVHADDTALERLSRRDQPGNESDNNDESGENYDEIPYEFSDEPPDWEEYWSIVREQEEFSDFEESDDDFDNEPPEWPDYYNFLT